MRKALGKRIIRLVLVEPEGKINAGFIIRLAKNFSINEICMVRPQFSIEDPEVVEFSAKASDLIPSIKIEDSLENCIKGSKLTVCTTSKSTSEKDVLRQGVDIRVLKNLLPYEGMISLIFGRESVGLKREELEVCDIISTIETGSSYNVLNVSHAVAIFLYELTKPEVKGGLNCDVHTLNAIRELLKDIKPMLKDSREGVVLKHLFFRSVPRRPECGAFYRFLKEIKKLLENRKSINP